MEREKRGFQRMHPFARVWAGVKPGQHEEARVRSGSQAVQVGREVSFRRVTSSRAENRRLADLEGGVDFHDCLLQVRGHTVTVPLLKFVAGFAQDSPGFGDLFVGLKLSFVL